MRSGATPNCYLANGATNAGASLGKRPRDVAWPSRSPAFLAYFFSAAKPFQIPLDHAKNKDTILLAIMPTSGVKI